MCNASALYTEEAPNLDRDAEVHFFGPASGRLDFQSLTQEFSALCVEEEPSLPSNHHQRAESHPGTLTQGNVSEELTTHLIDLYFKWEQPWCQVVDEAIFRRDMQNNGRYTGHLEVRADHRDPNTAGLFFLEKAEKLLQPDLKSPSITTIQSLAIMAVLYVAVGSDASGWLHHGMAIRLVLDMGFNFDTSFLKGSNSLSSEEVHLRRQIYWALYCTDKLWASYTGRVCTMLDSQGNIPLPSVHCNGIMEQASGSSSPRRDLVLSLHRSLSEHCQILEKILLSLYAPKKLTHDAQRRTFFDSCLLELKGWIYTLPSELKISRSSRHDFPQAYILNMVHQTSIILLAKPFLPKTRPPPSPAYAQGTLTKKAADLCIEAAMEIRSLGEQYRQVFGSFRRSPITATHCSLSAALIAANAHDFRGTEVNKDDRDCVSSCIQTLQELSDSWTPSRRFWRTLTGAHGPKSEKQTTKCQQTSVPGPDEVVSSMNGTNWTGGSSGDQRDNSYDSNQSLIFGYPAIEPGNQGFDAGYELPESSLLGNDSLSLDLFWPDESVDFMSSLGSWTDHDLDGLGEGLAEKH
ncbi:Transcription factor [Fusarium albosuccineum]|uniref:Transcription factor n=1 Tax=Fusarium albosuccineum TaxID=1237068 RepID=A0A8H4L0G3_9HYPO|nr:Transcription factor [Fusarium albosuccineum]